MDSKKDERISGYPNYAQALSGNFGHNQQIEIYWTYNAQLRFYDKRFDVRTDRWHWKMRKTVYKMTSRNMRNCDDELVQHLNCHAKQS